MRTLAAFFDVATQRWVIELFADKNGVRRTPCSPSLDATLEALQALDFYPAPGAEGEVREVLVVEGDAELRRGLQILLENARYRVVCAANGGEALERLRDPRKPGVVLTDLVLPDMTSDEFRAAQLGDPAMSYVPVLVFSGSDEASKLVGTMDRLFATSGTSTGSARRS